VVKQQQQPVSQSQSSPIGLASMEGHAAVIELLLAAGADVANIVSTQQ
jgi:hypothetical protein